MVLGLCADPVDARATDTPATAALTLSVDACDDTADLALLVPLVAPLDPQSHVLGAPITSDAPPRYEHAQLVFRPPRTYAFN